MTLLEILLKKAVEAAPQPPGFQTHPIYIVLNLSIPVVLGIFLVWVTKGIEKGLTRLSRGKS
jgi:hypothetical protein